MIKLCGNRLCLNYIIFIVGLPIIWNRMALCESDTKHAVVEFDPYVSILDKTNRSRYNVNDLQILIAKVATKFSKIYIEFTDADLRLQGTGLLQSPRAAATYNCLSNTSQKLELWLGLYRKSVDQINDASLSRISFIIKNTNKICNGTVTYFLISQYISHNEAISIHDKSWFQSIHTSIGGPANDNIFVGLGLLITFPYTCDEAFIDYYSPDLIVFRRTHNATENENVTDINVVRNCQQKLANKATSLKFGIMTSYPDTVSNKPSNRNYFLSSWKRAIKWSNESEHSVVLSRAFDTPYKDSVEEQTCGWWRVVDKCLNENNICNSTFVTKAFGTWKMDWKENPENYNWLHNKTKFIENSTGQVFYESDFDYLIDTSNLITVMITNKHLRILVLSELTPGRMTSGNFNHQNKKDDMIDDQVLIEPYGKDDRYTRGSRKNRKANASYSYSFDAKLCESYNGMESLLKQKLFAVLRNDEHKLFVFLFKEYPETIKLGARRMSEQRLVLFSQCRQMLLKSGNTKTEIGFALLEYPMPLNFFDSPWALQNVVLYWQILAEWASAQNNVVVFLPAADHEKSREIFNIGWWTPKPIQNAFSNYTTTLIDKQTTALKLSELRFSKTKQSNAITPRNREIIYFNQIVRENVSYNSTVHKMSGLNGTQIMLLVVGLLAFSALTTICSSFIIRVYYKKGSLSKVEIDDFFNGNSSVEVSKEESFTKVPYDKTKYEIDDNKYSFDDENLLGAGEFGKVLRGKVETTNGSRDVAVKTTNPKTNHVSTLKGLLSEVKLLAYIGKHSNIIELVGANTGHLKCGKIWIFLELCELGSLQKYIRNVREPNNFSLVRYSAENNEVNMSNLCASEQPARNKLIDVTLKNDLYRWATEICCAMDYLAKKHVVHADLATRNVLLSVTKEAKICDFGLSRRMYNYTDYVKTKQEPLPWKWMAPESLKFMTFSEKSDVWSFGITLWELYSLGETPYQGLSWDLNFSNLLERGLRPSEPTFNERDMYQLMLNCWNSDPEQRPTFAELYTLLTAND